MTRDRWTWTPQEWARIQRVVRQHRDHYERLAEDVWPHGTGGKRSKNHSYLTIQNTGHELLQWAEVALYHEDVRDLSRKRASLGAT